MKSYKDANSLKKNFSYKNKINSISFSLFNLKFIHKIFNVINFSLLSLIFVLFFLSFNSQRQWTTIYRNLAKTRGNNNNLIDYISKTEEFYINQLDLLNYLKKTTPKDLIYLDKKIPEKKESFFRLKIKYIYGGLKDSKYQRGY